jgi:hypothetical protein
MKISWGTGIVIAFVLFIGFILTMVITMSLDPRADHQMVTEDYYAKELVYQEVIDAKNRAKSIALAFTSTADGLEVMIQNGPEKLSNVSVNLYRAGNSKLDVTLNYDSIRDRLHIDSSYLVEGSYLFTLSYSYQNESYLVEAPLIY